MASAWSIFNKGNELVKRGCELGVKLLAAAHQGVLEAVKARLLKSDRDAYKKAPEQFEDLWVKTEAWDEP